jgi:glucokinase
MNNNIFGFDLGGTFLKYGIGNQKQGLIYFNKKRNPSKSIHELMLLFKKILNELLELHPNPKCISIASPGIIDCSTGLILGSTPNLPYLQGENLLKLFKDITSLPVLIDNDANLMTLAESKQFLNKSVLGITIGSGIGTGFVDFNGIFHGNTWKGLEAGHIIVIPNGRQCLCGKKGCFEAYASANSIIRIMNENFPETKSLSIQEILNLVQTSSKYTSTIQTIYTTFATALSNIIMILNPDVIVIGGGVIEIPSFDFTYLKKGTIQLLSKEYHNVIIQKALYGNQAGVIGAIILGSQT